MKMLNAHQRMVFSHQHKFFWLVSSVKFIVLIKHSRDFYTGCRSPPPSLTRGKAGRNHLNWDRRVFQPNHIQFTTFRALATMWTPSINETSLGGPLVNSELWGISLHDAHLWGQDRETDLWDGGGGGAGCRVVEQAVKVDVVHAL